MEKLRVLRTQMAPMIGNLRRKTEDRSKANDEEGEALELAEEHGVETISRFIPLIKAHMGIPSRKFRVSKSLKTLQTHIFPSPH